MAFPVTPLGVKVELQLSGTWTDVTAYTYTRDPITITRGRQDENGSAQPGSCKLSLNNRDGRFSPRNPTGPYYGVLGRNTPLRVSALLGSVRLVSPASGDGASTPDSAALSIVGDIDLRVDASHADWSRGAGGALLSKSLTVGQKSYRMGFTAAGAAFFEWSSDGTAFTTVTSTVPLPQTSGRQAIRATFDVDNGAGGNTATFYTAPTMSGTWTQLGAPVVTAGVAAIFNGTDVLKVGPNSIDPAGVVIYSAQVYQGIAGTVRANPDFTAQTEGAASFADAAGNTWTVLATGALTARRYRLYGEVPSWPQKWDLSQRDVWVPIEAAGVLRRLGQGASPLRGPIQRAVLRTASTVAYWPIEDGDGSTSVASGLPAGAPMAVVGAPRFAASDLFPSSGPLPEMALGSFGGPVSLYTPSGSLQARFLLSVPAAGDTVGAVLLRMYTTGTAARWDLRYTSAGGDLTLEAYDSAGVLLLTATGAFTVTGKPVIVMVELVQNGANIDWRIANVVYSTGVAPQIAGTLAGRTYGAVSYAEMSSNQLLTDTVLGHLMIGNALVSGFNETVFRAWVGETAGRRVERLCTEESIPFTGYGDLDDSAAMGAQTPQTLLELLAECEAADLGQVFESRTSLALAYRTRTSRAIQNVGLALAYGNLSELTPIEDDQATRNDVTVQRIRGSSARATVDTGPLSTQAPPNGVGRYDVSVPVSLYTDTQCADQANWRVTEGTVDEPRYPTIRTQLETSAFAASSALTTSALDVDHGDLITVTGTPVWLPPETIRQHTVGQVETLGVYDYAIEYVCQPATPVGSAGLYDDGTSRYAPSGSTLTSGITSTATGAAALSITTAAGNPVWTTAGADFPMTIVIAGERITLSAISGAASPQSATVSARSVNGVVKAQSAGAAIDIADPIYYAL